MPKTRKLYNSGSSTVVSLPPSVQDTAGLEEGDTVVLEAEDGRVHMSRAEISKSHSASGGDD